MGQTFLSRSFYNVAKRVVTDITLGVILQNKYILDFDCCKINIFSDDTTKIIQLQPALRFNGGGHINHSIFWENLSPSGGKPSGKYSSSILLMIYLC